MSVDTATKTHQHWYVCNRPFCKRSHAHRTIGARPKHPSRLCKCGGTAWYRYSNFVGDAKTVTRAHYAFQGMTDPIPTDASYKPLHSPPPPPVKFQDVKAGKTAMRAVMNPDGSMRAEAVPVPGTRHSSWGTRAPAPIPHHLRQGRRGWVVGTPEQELKHALNLLDEVMSCGTGGLTGPEFVSFCNDALAFMHAHGRQKYTDGFVNR